MPKRSQQDPTFLSIADIARGTSEDVEEAADRLGCFSASSQVSAAASSQVRPKLTPNIDTQVETQGFILADFCQVCEQSFYDLYGVGLVVCVLGMHSPKPEYPRGVHVVDCPIQWENGRSRQFARILPTIVTALSQGKNITVHCIESYHRGPMGLAAICKALFGFPVRSVLELIAGWRKVHPPYASITTGLGASLGSSLCSALIWAEDLELWQIPRPATAAAANRDSSAAAANRDSSTARK